MSTKAGNDANENGVNPHAGEEQTGDVLSISSPMKVNHEHHQNEIDAQTLTPPPTTTATVTRESTQAKEGLRTITEQSRSTGATLVRTPTPPTTSTTAVTGNSTQINPIKSGDVQRSKSVFSRLSTTVISGVKSLNLGSRKQQGRDNDLNELHEDVEIQDNFLIPSIEQQDNNEDFLGSVIGGPSKINAEHQKNDTAVQTLTPPPTSTTTVTGNSTQTKEELQMKTKQLSANSNTDSTQVNTNKSGGAQQSKSMLKRLSTTVVSNVKSLNLGNRKQQSRDNDLNELDEDKIQGQDISLIPPIEEHDVTTDLLHNKKDLPTARHHVLIEQPANLLSITTKVGDDTKQQQDRDEDDFVRVGSPGKGTPIFTTVSGSEKRIKEAENVSKHEMERASQQVAEQNTAIASLTKLVAEQIAPLTELMAQQNTAVTSLTKQMAEHSKAIAENNRTIESLKAQLFRNDPGSPIANDKVLRKGEVTTSPIQEQPEEDLAFRKADGISLTEVATLVKELNAQIDQTASLIMDLQSQEPSSPGKDSEVAGDGDLQDFLGSWLCNKLKRTSEESEIDPMVAQIALQAGLVHACSRIINDWNPPFWTEGSVLSRIYNNVAGGEGPITADTWKALARNYMASHEDQLEANKTYLEGVLLKLIVAVSGPSGGMLLSQCNEKVDDIARKAIDIHQVISKETRSTDLSTFIIEDGADFDQSRMEDTEGSDDKAGPTLPSKVVCTVEMGLGGKRRVPSKQQSGDGKMGGGVTLKAKVVLSATLS